MRSWDLPMSYDDEGIVDDAGHLVIEETPDELVKEILAFARV